MVVFGLMHERLIGRRGIQEIRQVHPFGIAHQTLGDPHRARRFRGDDSGPFTGPFHQFFMRHKFKHHTKLQRFLALLKIIAVVAPLLGLLGTVTGMINTFQVITLFGTGDPKLMAGGISQALVTTVLGLCVAVPTVLLHTLVQGRAKAVTQILQKRSIGIIAEHSEQGHVSAA